MLNVIFPYVFTPASLGEYLYLHLIKYFYFNLKLVFTRNQPTFFTPKLESILLEKFCGF